MFSFPLQSNHSVTTFVLSIAAGLLLGVGLLVSALWWFTVFGVALTLAVIERTEGGWQTVRLSLLIWWCKTLVVFSWVWDTYPLDWTGGASRFSQVALIVFFWFFTAGLVSIGGGVCGYSVWRVLSIERWSRTLWFIVPVGWVIGEWVGSLAFSIGLAGSGATITPFFSFGFIGYVLAAAPLGVWAAAYGDVAGLSVLVVLLGMMVWYVCKRYIATRKLVLVTLSITVIAVISLMPVATETHQGTPVRVAVVTTDFTSSLYVGDGGESLRYQALVDAVEAAVKAHPDMVVLPEDSRFLQMMYPGQSPGQAGAAFRFTHSGTPVTLIDSSEMVRLDDGARVVRVSMVDPVSGHTYQFDKQYLVPIGEYVPYVLELLMRLFGYGDALVMYQNNNSYTPGPFNQSPTTPAYLPGVVFCFEEVMSGAVGQTQAIRPAPFYTHSISHSWIHPSYIFEHQIDSMLQIQARVAGVPIITAANLTESKLYLPNGAIETGELISSGSLWRLHLFTW